MIWVVWQPYRELVEDAPPDGGCRVVVGQRSFGGCRLNQTACVEVCAIQVLQPRRQARQERVIDQVRYQLGEQFRPLLILRRVVGAQSPVESVLPGPRQNTSLLRPSWPQVGSFDLHRGSPNLKVCDQVSRQYPILFGCPGRSFAGRADLISSVVDQLALAAR
jgi:hypothetical protein